MVRASLAILAAALSLATSARAQDSDTLSDIRCLVVALDMDKSPDPQMRSLATSAGLYFVGRLRGRAPELDLETAIVQQLRIMSPQDLMSEGNRCGAILAGQADRLVILGEHLRAMAAAAPQPPPPPDAASPK